MGEGRPGDKLKAKAKEKTRLKEVFYFFDYLVFRSKNEVRI
jgi:hypothetical protein